MNLSAWPNFNGLKERQKLFLKMTCRLKKHKVDVVKKFKELMKDKPDIEMFAQEIINIAILIQPYKPPYEIGLIDDYYESLEIPNTRFYFGIKQPANEPDHCIVIGINVLSHQIKHRRTYLTTAYDPVFEKEECKMVMMALELMPWV